MLISDLPQCLLSPGHDTAPACPDALNAIAAKSEACLDSLQFTPIFKGKKIFGFRVNSGEHQP
jgi:hypothetical protein